MAIGVVYNCTPNDSCRMAVIDGWMCKIHDGGYAECFKNNRVRSNLSYWKSTSNGFRYGVWDGINLPGTLDISDKDNKPYEFEFNAGSADAYVTNYVMQVNYTSTKTPSVTGYSIYSTNAHIDIDHYFGVKGFFDFTGKDIKWL